MIRTGNEVLNGELIAVQVAAATEITEATMIVLGADGYAIPGMTGTGLLAVGRAERYCDNRNGTNGEMTTMIKRGCFVWKNAGDIEKTDLMKKCYIKDETTVTLEAPSTRSVAGTIIKVDDDGITVDMRQV